MPDAPVNEALRNLENRLSADNRKLEERINSTLDRMDRDRADAKVEQRDQLNRIEAQVTKTNGRVTELEREDAVAQAVDRVKRRWRGEMVAVAGAAGGVAAFASFILNGH